MSFDLSPIASGCPPLLLCYVSQHRSLTAVGQKKPSSHSYSYSYSFTRDTRKRDLEFCMWKWRSDFVVKEIKAKSPPPAQQGQREELRSDPPVEYWTIGDGQNLSSTLGQPEPLSSKYVYYRICLAKISLKKIAPSITTHSLTHSILYIICFFLIRPVVSSWWSFLYILLFFSLSRSFWNLKVHCMHQSIVNIQFPMSTND